MANLEPLFSKVLIEGDLGALSVDGSQKLLSMIIMETIGSADVSKLPSLGERLRSAPWPYCAITVFMLNIIGHL